MEQPASCDDFSVVYFFCLVSVGLPISCTTPEKSARLSHRGCPVDHYFLNLLQTEIEIWRMNIAVSPVVRAASSCAPRWPPRPPTTPAARRSPPPRQPPRPWTSRTSGSRPLKGWVRDLKTKTLQIWLKINDLPSLRVIEGLSCVIWLLGRYGLAATLGQQCPSLTPRLCKHFLY